MISHLVSYEINQPRPMLSCLVLCKDLLIELHVGLRSLLPPLEALSPTKQWH